MLFQVEIESANAAFDGEAGPFEVARILRVVADKLETGYHLGVQQIRDVNGNKVGTFQYDEES